MIQQGRYNLSIEVPDTYEKTRERAIAALKEQGFGVLTEIDVKATIREKLDLDFRKYAILGACNPPLAHRALSAETHIGVLLPCNVVVYEKEPGRSVIVTIDPAVQLGNVGRPDLEDLARDVRERMVRVLESVAK